MLKIISAAVLAASIFAAPALASNVRHVHGNPMGAHARLMTPFVKVKPVVKHVSFGWHHRHHKLHRHFHRYH